MTLLLLSASLCHHQHHRERGSLHLGQHSEDPASRGTLRGQGLRDRQKHHSVSRRRTIAAAAEVPALYRHQPSPKLRQMYRMQCSIQYTPSESASGLHHTSVVADADV